VQTGRKLLVLGSTAFLGRHVVEAALGRGHELTLFNRGRTNADLFPGVERLTGDRDGAWSRCADRGATPRYDRLEWRKRVSAEP
jgi:2'-hydroxyisoflavone reductase